MDFKRDVPQHTLFRKSLYREDGLADAALPGPGGVDFDLPVDHQVDQLVAVHLGGGSGLDRLAVAQDCDGIADLENFLQTMGDVNNGLPAGFQILNIFQQLRHFSMTKSRRRFIHDNDVGILCQYASDDHHLLIGDIQLSGLHFAGQIDFQLFELLITGGIQLFPVDQQRQRTCRLFAIEDVFRHRKIADKGQLLRNDGDAQLLCMAEALDLDLLPIEQDLSAVFCNDTGQDLHQGRFASAVLAQKGMAASALHLQINVTQRLDAAKALLDAVHLNDIVVFLAQKIHLPGVSRRSMSHRACKRTFAPLVTSSHVVNSSLLWLIPLTLGTKIMPILVTCERLMLS